MKKCLVLVKHSWAGSFSLDEWFDFECDARAYIADKLTKNRGDCYRLLNILVTDQEPQNIMPLVNVAEPAAAAEPDPTDIDPEVFNRFDNKERAKS